MHNAVPHDMEKGDYKKIKGNVYLGAFDFTYNAHNWVARGNIDYGYVSDAKTISAMRKPNVQYVKPYQTNQAFGSHAIATSVEVGYDIFSQIGKMRTERQKLYVFGHFEYYNSLLRRFEGIHKQEDFRRWHKLLPRAADLRKGRIQLPQVQIAIQRRAGTEHRSGLSGMFL